MSDTGGPEDPEVAKLREQLAAAERAAELRSELEAAKEELQAIDNKIGDASGTYLATHDQRSVWPTTRSGATTRRPTTCPTIKPDAQI